MLKVQKNSFTLFTPGPTKIHNHILELGSCQLPYNRTEKFSEITYDIIKGLRYVFQTTGDVAILTASGTAAMEASVINFLNGEDRVLIINGGTFGQRWVDLCQLYRIKYEEMGLNLGEGFIIVQLFLISIIFFSRKPALSTSWSQWDAGICIIAIFYVFFLEPNGPSNPHLAPIIVQVAGSLIIMGSYLSLNRSTGILPAKRAIKTNGLYCFIRHPMYAGYQIFIFGYILNNLSLHNIIVFSVGTTAQILRILSEEKFLDRDPDYIDYKASVKYRLLPCIF